MRHNFSVLNDICLYTEEEELPLEDAFKMIYEFEKGEASVDHKASKAELASRLEQIIPTYDKEEVTAADMKKLFKWYNTLVVKADWTPDSEEKKSDEEE